MNHKDIYDHFIIFDDLTKDPENSLKSLLRDIGWPTELASYGLSALEVHSQVSLNVLEK